MITVPRLLCPKKWHKLSLTKILGKEFRAFSTAAQAQLQPENRNEFVEQTNEEPPDTTSLTNYRHIYPEFLPDPNPSYRNSIREKLEREDMLARRSVINIPEFYVGSVLAVTYSEPHAVAKVNRFVGICINREGCGLRASVLLRNVVNGEAVEVCYNLYDPAIQKIDCLRLEKRLDDQLLYLRDAPLEYSTFPFDMEPELTPGTVPLNEIKIPLNTNTKWLVKWERENLKGVQDIVVNQRRQNKARKMAKPWEKYDLMKTYRATIPKEEQVEIFSDVHTELRQFELQKILLRRKQMFKKTKKNV